MLLDYWATQTRHPAPDVPTYPLFEQTKDPRRLRGSGSRRYRLAVLGRGVLHDGGITEHVTFTLGGSGRSRAAGAAQRHVTRSVEAIGTRSHGTYPRVVLRGTGSAQAHVSAVVRCADHTHLALPLPLLDLLTESWDS